MRERLQRRKKTTSEQTSQPAAPPLQPAYFDAEPAPAPAAERAAAERPADDINDEPDAAKSAVGQESGLQEVSALEAARADVQGRKQPGSSQRGRRRRRGRGGRGGSGRENASREAPGREKAVAQAFTPAAVKGLPPGQVEFDAPVESDEAAAVPISAPESAKPPAPAVVKQSAPKGVVVLAIGLPGSGKSSWFKRHSLAPLSSDSLRTLLFDDVREQRFQDLVFSNLRSMLKARLIARRPMNYVDATNLTPHERQHWVKLAKDYQYEVHALFFDVPLEVCIERHQRRDRVVPEEVMRRMAAKLKPPTFEEGFTKITVVRVKKKAAGDGEETTT